MRVKEEPVFAVEEQKSGEVHLIQKSVSGLALSVAEDFEKK